jgi:hypothetical protein
MERVLRVSCAVLATALLGACASTSQGEPGVESSPSASVASGPALGATFVGEHPGQVRITPGNGNRSSADITIRAGGSGERLAWVIKRGQCSNQGAAVLVGRESNYPPLSVRGDGTAQFRGNVNVRVPGDASHFIAVMRSLSDRTVLACADLVPVR